MRFQVRELLDRNVIVVAVVLLDEAEREELVGTVVVLGIPHDGLLGHTDDVAGWDMASVGEGKIFQDFALDGHYIYTSGQVFFFWIMYDNIEFAEENVQESKGSWRAVSRRKLSIKGKCL